MCGIVGAIASNLSDYEINFVDHLLMTSGIRGMDSTGVFGIFKDKNKLYHNYHKDLHPPHDFVAYGLTKDIWHQKRGTQLAVVGHNRAATVGKATKKNSHPFSTQTLLGVHNGTISEHHLKYAKHFETDSEALYNEIEEIGLEEMVRKLGRKLNCAYALVMYNKKQGVIRIVRNEDRPLAFAWRYGTLMFASENLHLEWVLNRNGGTNAKIARIDHKAEEFLPYHIYEWDLTTYQRSQNSFSKITDVTPKTSVAVTRSWGDYQQTPLGFRGNGRIRSDGRFHYDKDWDEANDRPFASALALPKPSEKQTSTTQTSAVTQTGSTTGTPSSKKPPEVLHQYHHGRCTVFREGIKPPFDIKRGRVRVWNLQARKWMLVHWEDQRGLEEIDPLEDTPDALNDRLPPTMLGDMPDCPDFLKRTSTKKTHMEKLEAAMANLGGDGAVSWTSSTMWQDEDGQYWTYDQVCKAITGGCAITGNPFSIGEVSKAIQPPGSEDILALTGLIVDNLSDGLVFIHEDVLDTEFAKQWIGSRKQA